MKTLFSIVVSFLFLAAQELPDVRERYHSASKTKQNAEQFYQLVAKYNGDNKTVLAYKGAGISLKSKFEPDRKLKRDFFIEGVKLVENAVKKEPNNVEIRLIRLSIQENTPKLLKYKANIDEDKKVIVTAYEKQSGDLKEIIQRYVKQSKVFTDKEKQLILK
ncbi:hypothetical protein FSS13T_06040 [Flavobacterium saliperosum S13]|uniref:Uncharacterized protein n=2 Tax=Flavobacterium saliperosum TaxID=329186 RepID=A0A1G4V9B3_9FLAO|nr:hypothetical protein [Flavobacterium saliperosum]ESU28113.1 hypothetical protein FSS13T_06040 [Flavobacterium saliperosum S13]SCX03195.1 hypothetical protein SAMN02927925_00632 [Flavobacterium saliperosum]